MHYSSFLKMWIKVCFVCGTAVIDFRTPPELPHINWWCVEFMKKSFIVEKEFIAIRSNSGYCCNKKCKAYMKSM